MKREFLNPDNPVLYRQAKEVKKTDLKKAWLLKIVKEIWIQNSILKMWSK